MNRQSAVPLLIAALLTPVRYSAAIDNNQNNVDDAEEIALFQDFAPRWKTDDADDRFPPLPIRWYVEHCRLVAYGAAEPQYDPDYNGSAGDAPFLFELSPLTLEQIEQLFPGSFGSTFPAGPFFRLDFLDGDYHDGDDPMNPRTWSIAQQRGDCVYGRCVPVGQMGSGQYIVQYYLFFGWNDVDADRNILGCPYGNHEGDIVCFEVWVDRHRPAGDQILQAIYHNHGRQVFVEPGHVPFEGGHPVVYLETESHELLPWSGGCGMLSQTIVRPPFTCWGGTQTPPPVGIAASEFFESGFQGWWIFGQNVGGECDDVPVVRCHYGSARTLFVTSIINLNTEAIMNPMHTPETRFIARYTGRYGNTASDFCDVATVPQSGPPVDSPKGPPYQGKLWHRAYRVPEVWVNPAFTANIQDGSSDKPASTLRRALAMCSDGGVIRLAPGALSGRMRIVQPCTLTAPTGPVTIGQ